MGLVVHKMIKDKLIKKPLISDDMYIIPEKSCRMQDII
jgi:hypothetical protein